MFSSIFGAAISVLLFCSKSTLNVPFISESISVFVLFVGTLLKTFYFIDFLLTEATKRNHKLVEKCCVSVRFTEDKEKTHTFALKYC